MNKKNRGYVMMLVVMFVPVILYGAKWILDTYTQREVVNGSGKLYKRCASECALAVAKHWNVGLSLFQQKEALLRVADEIYNAAPTYTDVNNRGKAVGGLVIASGMEVDKSKKGEFDPLKVKISGYISPKVKNIAYKQVESPWGSAQIRADSARSNRAMEPLSVWDSIFRLRVNPALTLEDSLQYMIVRNISGKDVNYGMAYIRKDSFDRLSKMRRIAHEEDLSLRYKRYDTKNYYTVRDDPKDGDKKLQISVENNKIKVTIDSDIIPSFAYAVPAECNVDIVLGVPINEAAHNRNNYDQRTPTQGECEDIGDNFINDNVKSTPIMQIGQELHDFVKNNFWFTRGVNVGIIPYSGQCSLDPNRMNSWTIAPPAFVIDKYSNGDKKGNINQNSYLNYVRQCFMYSAWQPEEALTAVKNDDYGINSYSGTNIYARGGVYEQRSEYGNNVICYGDLLSTDYPTSSDNQKFLRFSSQIIKGGALSANLLTGKWDNPESYVTTFCPFFIIELQSDLHFITDMLNCLCPFPRYKHINGTSNFIFIPVTWANNLFQKWTNDPKYEAGWKGGNSYLSQPSKMTEGRKKAVIIVVNKPDWFEPGEITYLGYDNDFSEVPLIESDTIRFDTDYSDKSKKFADGSSFNGTIQGQKKILKFTSSDNKITYNTREGNIGHGYYETTATVNDSSYNKGTLTFPKKYLLKIVVEPIPTQKMQGGTNLVQKAHDSLGRVGVGPVSDSNGNTQERMLMVCDDGSLYYSNDGFSWETGSSIGKSGFYVGTVYGNGIWNAISCDDNEGRPQVISADGRNWETKTKGVIGTQSSQAFGEGIFMATGTNGGVYTSTNALSWTLENSEITPAGCLGYGKSMWLCIDEKQNVYKSTDSGKSWTECGVNLNDLFYSKPEVLPWGEDTSFGWYGFVYAYGYFYAVNYWAWKAVRTKDGKKWEMAYEIGQRLKNITLFNDQLYSFHQTNGSVFTSSLHGIIKFTDINKFDEDSGKLIRDKPYTIKERTEFYIEPDQIQTESDGNYSVSFDMKSIRLISAEITNRPYTRVTPSCSMTGTTNGTGTATITTTVKKPMTVKVTSVGDSKIQFYSDNGVTENVGEEYTITGVKTFKFSGSDNLKNLENNQKTLGNFSTTGGLNFGHNFSTKKLKYSLINAKIAGATLKNQVLRYCGRYYYVKENGVNYNQEGTVQRIVPNTIVRPEWHRKDPIKSIDSCLYPINDTYYSGTGGAGWKLTTLYSSEGLSSWIIIANNLTIRCAGVKNCKYIATNYNIPVEEVIKKDDSNITLSPSNVALNSDMNGNKYIVVDLPDSSNDYVDIFTGQFNIKTKETWGRNEYTRVSIYFSTKGCGWGYRWGILDEYWGYNRMVWELNEDEETHKITHKLTLGAMPDNGNDNNVAEFKDGWEENKELTHYEASGAPYYTYVFKGEFHRNHQVEVFYNYGGCTSDGRKIDGDYWPKGKGQVIDNRIRYLGNGGSRTYGKIDVEGTLSGPSYEFERLNNETGGWELKETTFSPYRYYISSFYFLNKDVVSYQGEAKSATDYDLINNKGIYSLQDGNDTWLCFCGDGDLEVTVAPSTAVTHTDALGKTVTNKYTTEQTIRIDPENYKYEEQSDGTYKITLQIDGIKLSDLKYNYLFSSQATKITQWSYVYSFSPVDNLPCECKYKQVIPQMSAVVDFSKQQAKSNEADQLSFEKFGMGYDANFGGWVTTHANEDLKKDYLKLSAQKACGDFYCLIEDVGETMPRLEDTNHMYTGLYKYIKPLDKEAQFDFCWEDAREKTRLHLAGVSLPVNNFLYWGASGDKLHAYEWQSDKDGKLITRSATEAVRKVTVDACKKLKADRGENIRMYLIMYRKQSYYKHPVTGEATAFDYEYLSECASGTEAPYVYNISTQAKLKEALDAIAKDIKEWAGYEPAKNVD